MTDPPQPTPTRRRILEAVSGRPGATLADVARAAGVAHSTAAHHVARLAEAGALLLERHRGRVHCFAPALAARPDRALRIALRLDGSARVLARLAVDRGARVRDVARGLPMTKAGVLWHLDRLASLGLVEVQGPPRHRTYRAARVLSSAARNAAADANRSPGLGASARAIAALT